MRNYYTLIFLFLLSIHSFSAEKCVPDNGFSSMVKYPLTSFENTNLPKVRVISRLFEFADEKNEYEAICFNWPAEVKKHGESQACKGWCILPRKNISADISLVEVDASTRMCNRCNSKKTDSECLSVAILKTPSDQFKLGSDKNTSLLQMGSDGVLLIFQTTGGTKDLNKPYLTLDRQSEYFVKTKLDIKKSNVADTGYINTAKMTLTKASVNQIISAKSITQRVEETQGALPIDGIRSCKEVQLKISDCPLNVESFETSNYTSNRYSCKLDNNSEDKSNAATLKTQ